jgi:O-antigen/teichoic acid export membrane protein
MKNWFQDRTLRSLMKNSSYLAISKGVAGVGGIVTVAFAGRALGLVAFGLLILVHSYAQAASGLAKFNSWQVVVRYGGPALREDDHAHFKQAVGFAVGLDLFSGLVTMVLAMALLPVVGSWFGLPDDLLLPALLYCLILPTMGAGAASGVLRVFDRFDLLSWQGTFQPNLRALLALVAWLQGWGFVPFLIIWFVTDILGDMLLWFLAIRELKRRKLLAGIRPTLKSGSLDRGWPFALSVNLNQSFSVVWGPIARLVVGAVLTPAAAGLYRVASSIADAAQRPTDFLNKAFYPEVMRMDQTTKHPWRLMMRTMAISVMVSAVALLAVVVGGTWLLGTVFGPEFLPAYSVMLVLLGAPLIAMISFPIPAMLHAIGKVNVPLYSNFVGAIVYFLTLFPLTHMFGLIGAGIAFVLGRLVMTIVMAESLRRARRAIFQR